ncbi:unnamed protein product [Sphagnum tenellum]
MMDHLPQHCVEIIVEKVAQSEDVIDAAVSLARLSCASKSLHDAAMDAGGWKASVQLHFGVSFPTSKRAAVMFKQWYSFAREELAIIESKNQELNDQNLTALDELRREELLSIHLRVKNDEFTVAEANRRFGLMDADLKFLNQLRKEELNVFDRLREEQLTLAEVEQIYHLCEADLKHKHREAWLDTRYRPPALIRLFRLLDVLQTVQRKHGSMVAFQAHRLKNWNRKLKYWHRDMHEQKEVQSRLLQN